MSTIKNVNAVTSTDLGLYEHEGEQVQIRLVGNEFHSLKQYDMAFYDDEWLDPNEHWDENFYQRNHFPVHQT